MRNHSDTAPDNPFRPGFGRFPPELAGRHESVRGFAAAIAGQGTGTFLVRGHRGMGKTVLLSALEDAAREEGWLVVSATAFPGFVDQLNASDIPALLRDIDGDRVDRSVSGLNIGGLGGVTTAPRRRYDPEPTLYLRLRELLEVQAQVPGARPGVLLTVDEVEVNALRDVAQVATTMQRLLREDAPVAFVFAGLPHNIARLLESPHTTFLRRAERMDVGRLSWDAAKVAVAQPIFEAGRTIDAETLDVAVEATRGYPFLTQVVGAYLWDRAAGAERIPPAAAAEAAEHAMTVMGELVHEPALLEISPSQRRFLAAIAAGESPARNSDLARQLDVTTQRISALIRELSDHGLVFSPGRGLVELAVPYLGEYIRTHGTEPRQAPLESDAQWGPGST